MITTLKEHGFSNFKTRIHTAWIDTLKDEEMKIVTKKARILTVSPSVITPVSEFQQEPPKALDSDTFQ